jgi:beta-lactamase class D
LKKVLFVLLGLVVITIGITSPTSASNQEKMDSWGKYFGNTTGTIVVYSEADNKYLVFNEPQSLKRLSPCSTFKIYNSLIALETGVLDKVDSNTLIKWNGTQYTIESWNRDHTLASATANSVVWYFQNIASRIGSEHMQEYVNKLAYGNQDLSGGLTDFWLRSSLQISAWEQVDLLRQLYCGKLPFSAANIDIVKTNITQSKDNNTWFMGKTGSASKGGKYVIGWFVGCVEKQGKRYIFATNIEASDGASGGKAKEITTAVLRDLGIL